MENTALLIMDVQNAIVNANPNGKTITEKLPPVIEAARIKNIPVIYVVVGFRKGFPEVSTNNKMFGMIKSSPLKLDSEEAFRVHESVSPLADDLVITKKRVSAFAGSDLEIVLRAKEIKHIVLTGIATSGVVLSTLREAADKDLKITVLHDCCADADEEVHRVLTTKVFLRQADVMSAEEWN